MYFGRNPFGSGNKRAEKPRQENRISLNRKRKEESKRLSFGEHLLLLTVGSVVVAFFLDWLLFVFRDE